MFQLTNKVALVTGGGSGIGEAIARLFATQGAQVIVADVQAEAAQRVAAAITTAGGSATSLLLDVADEAQVVATFAAVAVQHGRLDVVVNNAGVSHVVVNNAGVSHVGNILETSLDDWERVMRVNARGVFLCAREAVRVMLAQAPAGGVLINMASVAGQIAVDRRLPLALHTPKELGIIVAAPLEYGVRTHSYLAALNRLGGPIKGVRRNVQDEADPQFCLRDDFIADVQLLAAHDWTFDICIRYHQLPAVTELVRRCPDVRFVLDHLGKPPVRQQQLDPWRDHLATLAHLPNVWCKLSGLVTEADHQRWQISDLMPYITHVLAVFGPERTLFGSDWPVIHLAATYQQWHTLIDEVVRSYADAAQQFWTDTAQEVYHLFVPNQEDTHKD